MSPLITMVVPYYRQPNMLRKQMETWRTYSIEVRNALRIIIVDDCSLEAAEELFKEPNAPLANVSLYRIDENVPWNRGMARNLGTALVTEGSPLCEAPVPWIVHVDTDHVLTAPNADALLKTVLSIKGRSEAWFRFSRTRIGKADETRKKDRVDPNAQCAKIHPHIDSYLTTPQAYWKAGGYNEDFSGVLGGGSPFLKEMEKAHGPPRVLENVNLNVYTRHAVSDSSENTLDRDPIHFKRRKQEIMAKRGTLRGHDPIRLPWHKVF